MVFGEVEVSSNPLFRGDVNDTELNACVGDNGGPYTLGHYANGFFAGADAMVDYARQRQTFYVDVLVYPVAFSYRHGIELYLKQILSHLIAFNQSGRKLKKGHNLDYYWNKCQEEIDSTDEIEFPSETLETMSELIGYFCEFDPSGQVFRYPEDIKGNQTIAGFSLINLGILSDQMAILGEHLNGFVHYLEEYLVIKADVEIYEGW